MKIHNETETKKEWKSEFFMSETRLNFKNSRRDRDETESLSVFLGSMPASIHGFVSGCVSAWVGEWVGEWVGG